MDEQRPSSCTWPDTDCWENGPGKQAAKSCPDDGRMVTVPAWALEDYERNSVVLASSDSFYLPRHRAAFRAIHEVSAPARVQSDKGSPR